MSSKCGIPLYKGYLWDITTCFVPHRDCRSTLFQANNNNNKSNSSNDNKALRETVLYCVVQSYVFYPYQLGVQTIRTITTHDRWSCVSRTHGGTSRDWIYSWLQLVKTTYRWSHGRPEASRYRALIWKCIDIHYAPWLRMIGVGDRCKPESVACWATSRDRASVAWLVPWYIVEASVGCREYAWWFLYRVWIVWSNSPRWYLVPVRFSPTLALWYDNMIEEPFEMWHKTAWKIAWGVKRECYFYSQSKQRIFSSHSLQVYTLSLFFTSWICFVGFHINRWWQWAKNKIRRL